MTIFESKTVLGFLNLAIDHSARGELMPPAIYAKTKGISRQAVLHQINEGKLDLIKGPFRLRLVIDLDKVKDKT